MPGARVLVVDDEALVRRVACEVLLRAAFHVQEASGGEQAIEIVRAGATFDAVLLDVTMPRMSGLETFRRLRALDPSIPIVLTSGYWETDTQAPFGCHGAAGFVQKPFTIATLVRALREAVGARARATA